MKILVQILAFALATLTFSSCVKKGPGVKVVEKKSAVPDKNTSDTSPTGPEDGNVGPDSGPTFDPDPGSQEATIVSELTKAQLERAGITNFSDLNYRLKFESKIFGAPLQLEGESAKINYHGHIPIDKAIDLIFEVYAGSKLLATAELKAQTFQAGENLVEFSFKEANARFEWDGKDHQSTEGWLIEEL